MGKTLVTGATGFTGSHLCKRLTKAGDKVVAFVRVKSNTIDLEALGIQIQQVDIKNAEAVKSNFNGISKVYHLAAAYRTEYSDRKEFQAVNVEATRNLLDAAQYAGVERFIHCSTVGVQGEIENPPADEEYRFKPGDHYQQSKLEGELLARTYFARGLPGTIVRPVGIYGPGDNRFLKLFKAINKRQFFMIGSGEVLYHMTYIDDLVEGLILVGTKTEALGEVFTIAGERYTTLNEVVELIARILRRSVPKLRIPFWPVFAISNACEKICQPLGIVPPLYPRRVEFFHLDRAFSIEKANRLLGYEPQVDLEEGLTRTADSYRKMGLI